MGSFWESSYLIIQKHLEFLDFDMLVKRCEDSATTSEGNYSTNGGDSNLGICLPTVMELPMLESQFFRTFLFDDEEVVLTRCPQTDNWHNTLDPCATLSATQSLFIELGARTISSNIKDLAGEAGMETGSFRTYFACPLPLSVLHS